MGMDEVVCAAGGTGADCNGNGVPDDCEHDCNGSGLPDPCDLAAGTSLDAGADGIPDECFPNLVTWIDDDAPSDPGPGDPSIGDPLEDGSPARPFDSLQEGLDAALLVDFVLVRPGTYRGPGNRDVSFRGKGNQLVGEGGPEGVVVDLQGLGRALVFESGEPATAHVKGLTIVGGSADVGGAILSCGGFPKIIECVFLGNAAQEGGAVAFEGDDQTLRNCVFAGNAAVLRGGAVLVRDGSTAFVRGCTIVGNTAGASGGGIAGVAPGAAGLRDSIVWDNAAPLGPQIALEGGGSLTVTHSNVQGGPAAASVSGGATLVWGSPNLDANPVFADPAQGDYHATVLSPGIDLGAPFYDPQPGETDIDGDPRIDGPFMDQGADELVCQADLGFGGPGSAVLKVCGRDLADGPAALLLDHAPPGQPAWIVVGLVANPVPLKGGLLVPDPQLLIVAVPIGAQGRIHVPGITASLVVVPIVIQVAYKDATQPVGFGFSNAVRVAPP
jgi:hypothetical protein